MGEWIQLRRAMSHDQLKRGWWYPVLDRTQDGMVRVSLNGGMALVHMKQIRLIHDEPQTATRLGPITMPEKPPGKPVAMMSFRAICPRNHEIGKISVADDQVECQQCGRTYPIEEELPIGSEPDEP
ncbi:hypothetical protein LCGC14_1532340 [marine sediment metagenome]|uniref:Uncharacterized protein n=1 Tax=marine sediment metagenome TaxID=412755 RepID=A0A0F9IVJ7_9ZZZZ